MKTYRLTGDENGPKHCPSTELRLAGYVVALAEDGLTALMEVETARPDLIVLDLD